MAITRTLTNAWVELNRIFNDAEVPELQPTTSCRFIQRLPLLSKRCEENTNPEGSNVIPTRQVMAALSRGHCYLSDSGPGVTSLEDTIHWGQLKNYGIRDRIRSGTNDAS